MEHLKSVRGARGGITAVASLLAALAVAGGACGWSPMAHVIDDQGTGGSGVGGSGVGGAMGTGGTAGARGHGHGAGGSSGGGGATVPPLTDFPAAPIIDPSAPANAPALFDGSAPRTAGAPCISSPVAGVLMPRNWLRPRFDYAAASGENLFEIVVSVAGFAHPLRVFTAGTSYALEGALWNQLRMSVNDRSISVTVRALTLASNGSVQLAPSAPATSSFVIAPVDAPGKIVYWALGDDLGTKVGSLKGFGIGEESAEVVLTPSQVTSKKPNDTCVGCHAATPDGQSVGFSMGAQNYVNTVGQISAGVAGTLPSYLTPAALTTMQTLHGIPAFSSAHWTAGDKIVLLSDTGTLHWVQLDGTATGTLARTGDPGLATEPAFSHDGADVVYVSTRSITDGRLNNGPADLYRVPYQNRAGGAALPLSGASDPAYTEYYPAFSPDDRLVAFTRIAGAGSSYSNSAAEIMVVPFAAAAGGTPVRLAANDAAVCQTGLTSPGLTNDWPKWSPHAVTAGNGTTYYWLTFSSKRTGTANAQLYITGLTVDRNGTMASFPALYLWNQPAGDGNHTPSWDDFTIPPIIVP